MAMLLHDSYILHVAIYICGHMGFLFWPNQISVYARIEHFFVFAFSFSLNTTKESQLYMVLYMVLSQDPIIFIKVFSAARGGSNLEHVCKVFLKCVFKFFQELYNLIDIFFYVFN